MDLIKCVVYMSDLVQSPAWKALAAHQAGIKKRSLRELFCEDSKRFDKLSVQLDGLLLDYSKNLLTEETLELLLKLVRQSKLDDWTAKMFGGEKINSSEHRAALHMALRAPRGTSMLVDGVDIVPEVHQVLDRVRHFSEAVRNGVLRGYTGKPFKDVVSIGIGGSALGSLMVTEALKPYGNLKLNAHFISNVDAANLTETLKRLDPESTLFIISSKTFTTLETLTNARSARDWLVANLGSDGAIEKHFVAVSANLVEAKKFGISREYTFELWDWVGGRYSFWSAMGLPIVLYVGMDNFERMLAGAHAMDNHFRETPLERNMPVILGMIGIWYANFFGATTYAVLPYDDYLKYFPTYLQQLEMESNGKCVDRNGQLVDYATGMVLFGEAGTNGQHSFYQLIHQGTQMVPADFIVSVDSHNAMGEHHAILVANCFAQAEALMLGKTMEEARAELVAQGLDDGELELMLPHKVLPGNRPSNTLLFDQMDPYSMGMLVALYEHKVFVQSVVWNVNPFDQWGVELGKQLANKLLPEIQEGRHVAVHDSSTNGLINHFIERSV